MDCGALVGKLNRAFHAKEFVGGGIRGGAEAGVVAVQMWYGRWSWNQGDQVEGCQMILGHADGDVG
jgi:hypothetical protein